MQMKSITNKWVLSVLRRAGLLDPPLALIHLLVMADSDTSVHRRADGVSWQAITEVNQCVGEGGGAWGMNLCTNGHGFCCAYMRTTGESFSAKFSANLQILGKCPDNQGGLEK